jgi:hypothetical protein
VQERQTSLESERFSAKKHWASMTLTFVGNVGAVMQDKTGPSTDTGQGGPRRN